MNGGSGLLEGSEMLPACLDKDQLFIKRANKEGTSKCPMTTTVVLMKRPSKPYLNGISEPEIETAVACYAAKTRY
jgi:hypothetical protein